MPNNNKNRRTSGDPSVGIRRIPRRRVNSSALSGFYTPPEDPDNEIKQHMAAVRRDNNRLRSEGALGAFGPSGVGVSMATGRPRDPMFYWRQNNLPFDFTKPAELRKIREFLRLLYMTHPIVAACVDIYSKLPLQGMHLKCKDPELVKFYEDLFFDQLNYEDHLVKMGRQYWLAGECFSIGAWNEDLGIWEDEQLVNPDDVEVESSIFINKPRYLMRLPESLREVLTSRQPVWEYEQLMQEYPELAQYTKEDDLMPISNYIMYQMKFEADDYSNRGISIIMRAFRTIIQEEMLMTALDAIADRLYTPLIVAKLGASATDLGTDAPWVPTGDQKMEFMAAMDAALSADFRVMVTHFATEIESLFGRENVPDLSGDFDRITERILMAFGLSETMLTGANAGETYAADALNRDVVTQLLTHYQRKLKLFFRARAEIVAEAQEHFDYDVRDNQRYLVTEEIWEVDEETGEGMIIERPKLLVPELEFKILNLTDEQVEREFLETMATEAGAPIPYQLRLQSADIDFDDMIEMTKLEKVKLNVAEQEVRKETFLALRAAALPIPPDLLADFGPKAMTGMEGQSAGAEDVNIPGLGSQPADLPNLAPSPEDLEGSQMAEGDAMMQEQANAATDPMAQLQQPGANVPPESTEQMGRMPKPVKKAKAIKKLGIRQVTAKNYQEPDNSAEVDPKHYRPTGKFGDPKHVGMRRYLSIPEELIARDDE